MTSKPFYLSLTIVGALVHLFITLAALFGVDLGDQAGAITKTIEQISLAAGSFLATFSTIVGRIRASKQITLGRGPAPAKTMLLLLLTAGAAWSLWGCAGTAQTTATESYLAEAAGVAAVTATVELEGGKPGMPSKAGLATDFLTIANAGYTITSNGSLTQSQIDAIFESFKSDSNTTQFDTIALAVAQQLELYLQANPNTATQTILTNFFQGVQIAATALGGTAPAAPVATASATH